MYLEFEPHSWYMGFAIKHNNEKDARGFYTDEGARWQAFTDDGNTYKIVTLESDESLDRLKQKIRMYHLRKHTGYGERLAKRRLEYLRGELRAERLSYGELAELQGLADYIEFGDVELLEPAGVPEGVKN